MKKSEEYSSDFFILLKLISYGKTVMAVVVSLLL